MCPSESRHWLLSGSKPVYFSFLFQLLFWKCWYHTFRGLCFRLLTQKSQFLFFFFFFCCHFASPGQWLLNLAGPKLLRAGVTRVSFQRTCSDKKPAEGRSWETLFLPTHAWKEDSGNLISKKRGCWPYVK